MKVLLSIKPEYAEKILTGEKRFEYRKVRFSKHVSTVILYATSPVSRLVGEFEVDSVLEDVPTKLWEHTKEFSGITREFFRTYFSGRDKAVAIKIGVTKRYQSPQNPNLGCAKFTPPQSFCYLQD
jgi:Uncharacterized conserved protein